LTHHDTILIEKIDFGFIKKQQNGTGYIEGSIKIDDEDNEMLFKIKRLRWIDDV
jgi:hypothetical protein